MRDKKYYFCKICGNLSSDESEPECCNKKMEQILCADMSADHEKHTPTVDMKDGKLTVTVGGGNHPMQKEHLVEWVYLKTDKGRYIKYLNVDEAPRVTFSIKNEVPLEVSAYCNKHGLWHAEM